MVVSRRWWFAVEECFSGRLLQACARAPRLSKWRAGTRSHGRRQTGSDVEKSIYNAGTQNAAQVLMRGDGEGCDEVQYE